MSQKLLGKYRDGSLPPRSFLYHDGDRVSSREGRFVRGNVFGMKKFP